MSTTDPTFTDEPEYTSASELPHRSIAIFTSERAEMNDFRVCELAVGIIEAQRREIDEMDWLINDIDDNGPAKTEAEAQARAVPTFVGTSIRTCTDSTGK